MANQANELQLRPIENEERRRDCFRKRRPTIFAMARDLSEEFGAHIAVVAFSPSGEAHAFGGPTTDSVLRTYLSAGGQPPQPLSAPPLPAAAATAPVGGETAGEAAARVVAMKQEEEQTNALVAEEWARVANAMEKVRALQAAEQKQHWWEVDVDALGEEELPVFLRALELLKADVQARLDAMASARLSLPLTQKKKQQ